MKLGSQTIALILSLSVASITTAFLFLIPSSDGIELFITFILSFGSCYLLSIVILDFVFFREINTIYDMLRDIKQDDKPGVNEVNLEKLSINPLRKINQEIYSYAQDKRREIDQLRKMEAFRREFIADVSHELKTPIFAAQGFVHTLLDGAVEDKKVRMKFLKKAGRSLDGLDILVQDLLTISQIETGQIKMHFEIFDIAKLAHDVIDQLEDKAGKKNVNLSVSGKEDEAVLVYADKRRIGQVLTNLVLNAIKYNAKKGDVIIYFQDKENKVQVCVKDTGIGIPEEDVPRIFERFYRVEKSRSKDKGGTGLGLSIVKHIIEGHQGNVDVASNPGKGSVFSFELAATEQDLPETYEFEPE